MCGQGARETLSLVMTRATMGAEWIWSFAASGDAEFQGYLVHMLCVLSAWAGFSSRNVMGMVEKVPVDSPWA